MDIELLKTDKPSKKAVYLKGGAIGVAVSLIFMLIFSAVLLFFNLDRTYAKPFSTVSVAVGSFAASFYAAKKIGDRGYLSGIIVGTSVFVLITLISMIINKAGLNINTLFHFIIIVFSSVTGGIFGVNRDKGKKYI